MKGINKVILIGHTGQDPDVRYTQNGTAVVTCSLATSEYYKDKNTGERIEKTEWHNLVAFGKVGEIMAEYVRKGSKLYIEGSLNTQEYEKDGIKRKITKVVIRVLNLLGDSPKDSDSNNTSKNQNNKQHTTTATTNEEDFDDAIPF